MAKPQWVSTSQAAAELGCRPKYLRSKRDVLFKRGKHYRVLDPTAWRPTYRWHVARIQKVMENDNAPSLKLE